VLKTAYPEILLHGLEIVAKAAFFPQISLTGLFGAQCTALTSFLQGPATVWSLGGEVLQPLYAGGAIRSAYDLPGHSAMKRN